MPVFEDPNGEIDYFPDETGKSSEFETPILQG